MWSPTSDGGIVGELRAHAKDVRNWLEVIEGAVIDLEDIADIIEARLPEMTPVQLQHLLVLRAGYEADPTRDLAEAHRHLERWAQALRHASRER